MRWPKKVTVRRWLAYSAFSWVAGLLFLYLTFPWQAVRERLEETLERALSTPSLPVRVAVGELRPSWFTGIVARNVVVTQGPAGVGTSQSFSLPEIDARLELLPLLRARPTVDFALKGIAGQVEGAIAQGKKESDLSLELKKVDLAKSKDIFGLLGLLSGGDLTTLDLGGTLQGNAQLSLDPRDVTSVRGTVQLSIQQGVLRGGHVGELDLPMVGLGTVELKAHASGGKLDFDKLALSGGDVDLETDGAGLVLNRNLGYSMPRGKLRLRIGQDLQKRIPYLGMGLSALHQPDREGYYNIPLGGTLKNPRFM
ncbi:MAG: type II secretion system protein GspN [Deltaproteobacteria bacterium]